MAAAEFSPLARTGGLGEAVAGLAGSLAAGGADVTVAIPRYQHLFDLGEPTNGEVHLTDQAVPVVLVDVPEAFDRPGIYGPDPGTGYEDQWFRFGLFTKRIVAMAGEFDVLHLHDGHVAPAALGATVPTVQTIHNASYSIMGPLAEVGTLLAIAPADLVLGGPIEWYGEANFLKAGIDRAHAVTTVSPTFALQVAEDLALSGGLDVVIRNRATPIVGILNGIDLQSWDPASDPTLPKVFDAKRLGGRAASRTELLARTGLAGDGVVFGNVGRLSEQKGLGLLDPFIDELVDEGFRLVLVGDGELGDLVDGWAKRHPTAVAHLTYTEELARLTCAGSDSYVMPSRFEPCGLGQMYAMRYGAPPVARLTGGLADTVIDIDEHPATATGFGFRSFTPESLAKTIRRAMRIHRDNPAEWRQLQRNGMTTDFSWDAAAGHYLEVYRSIT
jgi:starch synthase